MSLQVYQEIERLRNKAEGVGPGAREKVDRVLMELERLEDWIVMDQPCGLEVLARAYHRRTDLLALAHDCLYQGAN